MVLAQSACVPQFPERSGVIRVNQYKQSLVIESDGKKGSKGKAEVCVGALTRATHGQDRADCEACKLHGAYSLRSEDGHKYKTNKGPTPGERLHSPPET